MQYKIIFTLKDNTEIYYICPEASYEKHAEEAYNLLLSKNFIHINDCFIKYADSLKEELIKEIWIKPSEVAYLVTKEIE